MKTFATLVLVCLGLWFNLQAQEKKLTVAVLEFQRTGGLEANEATTLTNRFRGMLVKTNAFVVVEREKMTEILKEQDFTMSDQCNSAECAVQIGQLLGVEAMIAGDIGKVGKTWTLDLRMVDVSTGKIIKTFNEDYKGEIDGLLEIMKKAAMQFAEKESELLTQKDKSPTGTGTQVAKKGSSMKWVYIGAGVAAAGGAAVILLGGKKGGGGLPGINPPNWPTDIDKK